MGLFSLVLEVLMLIGLLGAAACTVLETLKPECSDLLTERCTALGHSTSMMLLVCLILVIGAIILHIYRKSFSSKK
jgi:hypothetical protein